MAANVADKRTSNTFSNHDAILATLKTISDRLNRVEKGGGGRRRHGRGRDGADTDANTQATSERRKPCVQCAKRHKLPDKKC